MPTTLPHFPARDTSTPSLDRQHGSSPERPHPAERKNSVLRPLVLWHLCSLDAPSVAFVWSLSFAWAMGVRLAAWVPVLQVLAVWTVYVCDRLLDARSAFESQQYLRLRERHFFHWRHRRAFLPLAICAACAAGGLVLAFMPIMARERNSVLAAACLAYFARVHSGQRSKPFLPAFLTKELLVGILFTTGCALPVFGALWASHSTSIWLLLCVGTFFALLGWLNCRCIDGWESAIPNRRRRRSSSAAFLLAACGLLLFVPMAAHPRVAMLLLAGVASALLLALLDLQRKRLRPVTLRAVADLVLLTPVLLLVCARWMR